MIKETFIWAVSESAVAHALVCDFEFYVTKPKTEQTWYTEEEKQYYRSIIIGEPIAIISWTGKTHGMTDATKFCTKIYATKSKTVFVALNEDDNGRVFVEGISKKKLSTHKFSKYMKRLHEREQWCLDNKREFYVKYLPETADTQV